jgi:hypothetical protein
MKEQEDGGTLKVNKHVISLFVAGGINLLAQSLLVVNSEAGL